MMHIECDIRNICIARIVSRSYEMNNNLAMLQLF